jgi:transcriptional regulator with XRE-family HTH domain
VEEYESLQELRKARKLTQMQVANMKQANVSQFEQRTDMRLSALQRSDPAVSRKAETVG